MQHHRPHDTHAAQKRTRLEDRWNHLSAFRQGFRTAFLFNLVADRKQATNVLYKSLGGRN